ncbi:MAG: DNA-directed RNA polymerase subunit omega [Planctomycetes bacterium]|nr:DNA-directed RNA polymerase subunit omega [Planctomycetota bacterium]
MSTFDDRFSRAMGKVGGRYILTALLQKRIRELVRGDKPLAQVEGGDFIDVALAEVIEGKIEMGEEIHDPEDVEIIGGQTRSASLDLDHDDDRDQLSISF